MRILSLGHALPDSQIDNYSWANALSFFDYDAMVVDPALAVSSFIEGVTKEGTSFSTYTEEPVEDGVTTATSVGLADLLRRRQEETQRLLARGGLIVCFAQPDVPHAGVSGFNGCHRYYWLLAPPGLSYSRPYVSPANGTEALTEDYEHPFAEFLERFRGQFLYRASFSEGAAGFGDYAKVFGRSPGGAAVAIDLRVGGGRVVFLPALPERYAAGERVTVAEVLVGCIRNALLTQAEEKKPDWLQRYPLPGLKEAQRRLERAESRLEALENEVDEARNEFRGIERYRRILWQSGKYGLDLPVRDSLTLLGCVSYSRSDEPATFNYQGETVFVETEGSDRAVGMDPHYRLRQRLERMIAQTGSRPKGLIVINGYRDRRPSERDQQYEDSLRVAAESMRYAVVESSRLFEAVRAYLAGETEKAAGFVKRLLTTEGIFEDEEELQEGDRE